MHTRLASIRAVLPAAAAPAAVRTLVPLLLLLLVAASARADVPEDVHFQGLLVDAAGRALPGPVDLQVRIFDAPAAGSLLYEETHADVALEEGVFSVLLGTGLASTGSFDAALFAGASRWLEVGVEGEVLAPRQPVSAVPYAFQALTVGGRPADELADAGDLAALEAQLLALQAEVDGLATEVGAQLCGNGALDGDEVCDDGNNTSGDGCESDCTPTPVCPQAAPADVTFNNPLEIPLDTTTSVLDFVSHPDGDLVDQVRYSVTGMNPNPALPGGQARLTIAASCFGEGTQLVRFTTGGQTFGCGTTLVDRDVTAASDTGTITVEAVDGVCTYVQWVLSGTAVRTN